MTDELPWAALALARCAPPLALVLGRITRALPLATRLAAVAVLTVAVSPWVALPHASPLALDAAYVVALARELALGLALALVLNAPFLALEHAGALLDTADSSAQEGPLAQLLQLTGAAVFLTAGGLRGVLRALAVSWEALPPSVAPRPEHVPTRALDLALRWTAESLGAAMLIASAALLAAAVTGLVVALASRFSEPLRRADLGAAVRAPILVAALAVALSASTELALDLASRSIRAAEALR